MRRNRNRQKQKRDSINLMTVIAYDETSVADARNLLKEYNKPDAVNQADLEQKLANLYTSTDDKVLLEKKLANIHPHKKWLIRTLELQPKQEIIKIEQPVIPPPVARDMDVKSIGAVSNFDASSIPSPQQKDNTPLIVAGMVTVTILAIVAISFKN